LEYFQFHHEFTTSLNSPFFVQGRVTVPPPLPPSSDTAQFSPRCTSFYLGHVKYISYLFIVQKEGEEVDSYF